MLMRLLIVWGILAFSIDASAEKLNRSELNKVLENLHPVKVKHQGKNGIWFSEEEAEGILGILDEKLPLALDIIDNQDIQIKALGAAIS